MSLDFKLRRTLRGLSYDRPLWNSVWLGPLEPSELADLVQEPVDVAELYREVYEVWNDCQTDNLADRTLEFYTRMYLANDILVKSDRASMLNSLEVRSPFLDNDLADFARRLPSRHKARHGRTKILLKRAMEPLLPAGVLKRKKKGFGIPLAAWLKDWPVSNDNSMSEWVERHLDPNWNTNWVARRWSEHRAGQDDHRLFLWSWLALQHHHREDASQMSRAA